MTLNRRDFMARTGALAGAAALPGTALAADTIKLGSILDTSGIFDAYGTPMDMAMRLAVQEINAGGGLNGKEVEVVSYDTQSDMALYSQYAQHLVRQDRVDVVHGGILSASREAIRQTLRKSKTLYFYNVLYEGGVCDRNIFIDGVTPAQQVQALDPLRDGPHRQSGSTSSPPTTTTARSPPSGSGSTLPTTAGSPSRSTSSRSTSPISAPPSRRSSRSGPIWWSRPWWAVRTCRSSANGRRRD